jgi:hypothetical protein
MIAPAVAPATMAQAWPVATNIVSGMTKEPFFVAAEISC